jgi:hypothetical protein
MFYAQLVCAQIPKKTVKLSVFLVLLESVGVKAERITSTRSLTLVVTNAYFSSYKKIYFAEIWANFLKVIWYLSMGCLKVTEGGKFVNFGLIYIYNFTDAVLKYFPMNRLYAIAIG